MKLRLFLSLSFSRKITVAEISVPFFDKTSYRRTLLRSSRVIFMLKNSKFLRSLRSRFFSINNRQVRSFRITLNLKNQLFFAWRNLFTKKITAIEIVTKWCWDTRIRNTSISTKSFPRRQLQPAEPYKRETAEGGLADLTRARPPKAAERARFFDLVPPRKITSSRPWGGVNTTPLVAKN